MFIIALIVLIGFVAAGALKHFTAPSVEAHLAARAAYRENMSNIN
jgi:hypothetical protein